MIAVLLACCWLAASPVPVSSQEPGQAVLARRDILEDFYFYPATLERVEGDLAQVLYEDGRRAFVPKAAVLPRVLSAGDFVLIDERPARVVSREADGSVVIAALEGGASARTRTVRRAELRAILRTDLGMQSRSPDATGSTDVTGATGATDAAGATDVTGATGATGATDAAGATDVPAVGSRVLAKWDARSWWVADVRRVQGEALDVAFLDGSRAWIPANKAVSLAAALSPGAPVLAPNPMDGQVMPATLIELGAGSASLRFFDGSTRTISLAELVVFHDQVGLRFGDPCAAARSSSLSSSGARALPPHADVLRSWLTPSVHYYFEGTIDPRYETRADTIELGLVYFVPRERAVRADALPIVAALAAQVEAFLERELAGASVTVRVHDRPVIGKQTLEWYIDNLDEDDAWHVWAPTADAVRAVFPDGPKKGVHRVVVLIPDAPGISADDSGTEDGMGFVRAQGDWLEGITIEGLEPPTAYRMSHDQWKPDYLAGTLAHEVLHTIGLPHTDGDPWAIMNVGPWFPISHPRVHLAELHKLVLRSPFRSLSLSQGMAAYVLDGGRHWLDVVRARDRWDTRLRLYYTDDSGRFDLRKLMASFGPESNGRAGVRDDCGERVLCRSHLASFVAFYLEAYGPEKLKRLTAAADGEEAERAAAIAGSSVDELEASWQAWLKNHGA